MSDGHSRISRAFQVFLKRAPKHAGAWTTAVQGLGEASALDKKISALAYLAVLASASPGQRRAFSREARKTCRRVLGTR